MNARQLASNLEYERQHVSIPMTWRTKRLLSTVVESVSGTMDSTRIFIMPCFAFPLEQRQGQFALFQRIHI